MSAPIFPIFTVDNITAYSSRRGVHSPGQSYSGFNVCHYTGDTDSHIADCLDELSRHTGIATDRIIIPRQTHSSNVLTVTSLPVRPAELDNIDAIVTDMPDIIIGVNTADCVPVILIEPDSGITAVAHAGWRGAVGGIVESTIESMITLGANPEKIRAAMGPSICSECFEVGEEVASLFDNNCIRRTPGTKPHVSLHSHITKILLALGLHNEHIAPFDKSLCTRCHPDEFWSARVSGINSGRVFTFVIARNK